jgi:hypothetical protein
MLALSCLVLHYHLIWTRTMERFRLHSAEAETMARFLPSEEDESNQPAISLRGP